MLYANRCIEGTADDSAEADQDSTTVNYSRLYTFIYGTYPINFLTFLTNPRRYSRMVHSNLNKYINFDIDDISRHSQHLSRRHLLHPNFFRYTFETEISDSNRWEVAGTAEDIAAFCITLDTGNMEMPEVPEPAVIFRGFHDQAERTFHQSFNANGEQVEDPDEITATGDTADGGSLNDIWLDDIPDDSFLFSANGHRPTKSSDHGSIGTAGQNGLRTLNDVLSSSEAKGYVRSNAGSVSSMSASADYSTNSQKQSRRLVDIESILDSHKDINSRAISRRGSEDGSMNQASPLTRVSSADPQFAATSSISPTLSREAPSQLTPQILPFSPPADSRKDNAPLESLSQVSQGLRDSPLRDSPLRDSPSRYMLLSHNIGLGSGPALTDITEDNSADVKIVVAYFQRQLLMLRNELNFERYLKQLRLRNLRRLKEQYSELQRDDANTQGLILSNKMLQVKMQRLQNDAKKQHASLTNIAADRAKYANQLLQKNRDLRAERDTWKAEEENVRGTLEASRREVEMLKKGFLDKEAEIERLGRRLKDATANVGEADTLRVKYSELRNRVFELNARGSEQGTKSMLDEESELLRLQIAKLEMRVKSAELEKENARKEYAEHIQTLDNEMRKMQLRK